MLKSALLTAVTRAFQVESRHWPPTGRPVNSCMSVSTSPTPAAEQASYDIDQRCVLPPLKPVSAGKTVLAVYYAKPLSAFVRWHKMLLAFKKTPTLGVGQSATVQMLVNHSALSSYDYATRLPIDTQTTRCPLSLSIAQAATGGGWCLSCASDGGVVFGRGRSIATHHHFQRYRHPLALEYSQ